MTAEESPVAKNDKVKLWEELRKSLTLAVPTLLLGMAVDWLKNRIVTEPGQALLIIIPALVIVCLALFWGASKQRLKPGPLFIAFFAFYMLIFFVAAETGLLDWKRSLVGYKKSIPPNPLALNHLGDWHYRFASNRDEEWDLAVVLMKPAQTTADGRSEIANLIRLAQLSQAKGIALDFYFGDDAEDNGDSENNDDSENNGVDDFLCAQIESAKQQMPVFVAYDYAQKGDRIDRLLIDPDLEKCVSQDKGHILGYAEWDGIVRSVPLYFWNSRSLESLSLRIAKSFDPQVKVPANGLLQFTNPENDLPTTTFERLMDNRDERSILTGRFILVGEESVQDRFPTPYGEKPGVVVHAYAAYSLKHNRFIQRPSWWFSLLMIFLCCYLIIVFTSHGAGILKLIVINAFFSLLIAVISVFAMFLWLTWIDVVYPLTAIWLFLPLMILMSKMNGQGSKAPSAETHLANLEVSSSSSQEPT